MEIEKLLLLVVLAPVLACSSIPFMPQEGAGASLSLATVAYVNEADRKSLESELPSRLDAMLVDDRKQISQLQQRVLTQETQLEHATEQLAALSQTLDTLSDDMRNQAQIFQALAQDLQATTARLDTTLTALPTDTLRLFSKAVDAYLAQPDAVERQESTESMDEAAPDEDPPPAP